MRATEHDAGHRAHQGREARARAWWPHAKRGLTLAFFALLAWLLFEQARGIEWLEVGRAMTRLPSATIAIAAALATLSYLVYTSFDLIGRAYTGHALPTRCVMLVAFISYAFNLNIGSLVGGIAFRYRLYTEFGLGSDVITRVLSLSMLTNWLGYFVLGGGVLCFFTPALPPRWQAEWNTLALLLPWLGGVLLIVAGSYLLACAFSKRRRWRWRAHTLVLPTARMALLQLALAMLNWMLIGAIVFTVLQARVDYPTVLAVLLIAAVAGLIVHVPAGLGVIEAVFVAMLSSRLPATEILAGLLAYRAVYYLLPLGVATVLYTGVEWRARFSSR